MYTGLNRIHVLQKIHFALSLSSFSDVFWLSSSNSLLFTISIDSCACVRMCVFHVFIHFLIFFPSFNISSIHFLLMVCCRASYDDDGCFSFTLHVRFVVVLPDPNQPSTLVVPEILSELPYVFFFLAADDTSFFFRELVNGSVPGK